MTDWDYVNPGSSDGFMGYDDHGSYEGSGYSSSGRSPVTIYLVEKIHETKKAALYRRLDGAEEWFPKSQITKEVDMGGGVELTVSGWIYGEKIKAGSSFG